MPILKSLAVLALGVILALWVLGAFEDKPPLPKLVANMAGDFYGDDPEFQRRVTAAYPSPLPLAALTKDLSDQGFTIEDDAAVFDDSDIACQCTWTIYWQVEDDNATQIKGSYSVPCL
jgi:hypothetical protein